MRSFLKFLLFLSISIAAVVAAAVWWANAPIELRDASVEFRISSGSSLRSAASQMREAGVGINPDLLALLARWRGVATTIKAGSYAVNRGITPEQLLAKLARGDVTQGESTLVDGWTFAQWRARLDQHPDLKHETRDLAEAEIAARLGIEGGRIDGWLFPDTYLFDKQSSDLELFARAHRAMRKKLDGAWSERDQGLPYRNPYEALIMASIIEKETGRADERTLVAAVFVNRLRKGMLLQT
ncbi:MAG TPA: endolytic transglycosylase MltG, partial [Azonexus sp.]|nr:endolytic transglycosylase MltG [Azonexus sp.]